MGTGLGTGIGPPTAGNPHFCSPGATNVGHKKTFLISSHKSERKREGETERELTLDWMLAALRFSSLRRFERFPLLASKDVNLSQISLKKMRKKKMEKDWPETPCIPPSDWSVFVPGFV